MSELEWGRPWLWPALLAAPILWFVLLGLGRSLRRGIERYGAVATERPASAGSRATLWTLAFVCVLLAWMEPKLGEEKVPVERRGLDLVFCLDTSRSMLARDIAPDRLARAKRDIRSVLPKLVGGDRVGLVAFSGQAKLVVPLTHDLNSFDQLLEPVDTDTVRKGGSDLAAALRKALTVVEDAHATTTVIVMFTDGEDLTGAGRQAATEVADAGVVLHTIGYGSTRGSKITLTGESGESFLTSDQGDEVVSALDADGLRRMSNVTGGEFLRADAVPLPLVELKEKRMDPAIKRSYDAGEETLKKTRFQWVLLPAVVLLLLELWTRSGRSR